MWQCPLLGVLPAKIAVLGAFDGLPEFEPPVSIQQPNTV
jgi:hypothetical protein